ncbi:NET1-associated nuclear protein 1, partial [Coemansia nantahalensis]
PVVRKGAPQPGPAGLLCASTGRDGAVRVWELQTAAPAPGPATEQHAFWTCRATARYRGLQPHGCAFSGDGSTLAVTFGGAVTLWDAQTCAAPVATLVASGIAPQLTGAAFIGSTPYLAAWSAERLDVWNMLTGSVWWTLAMPIRDVFAHPRAALLAVVAYQIPGSSTASIMVYSPTTPTPLAALQHPGGVDAVALVPAPAPAAAAARSHPDTEDGQPKPDPLDGNTLVVLTPTGLISVYGAESEASVFAASAARRPADAAARPMSSAAFSAIFGPQPAAAAAPPPAAAPADSRVPAAMRLVRSAVQASYLSAPHHVLPPVASLYDHFVAAQLLPAPSAAPAADASAENTDADGDIDMADDTTPAPRRAVDLWGESSTAFFVAMRKGYGRR